MSGPRIFTKQAISIDDQLTLLRGRGLVIADEAKVRSCLTHIGYYRLSAYELPFQRSDHTDDHHQFLPNTNFDQILDLYTFDRKLRLLVMDAIERIEVAIKSIIINEMCIPYGPHWYMDRTHFVADFDYDSFIRSVHKDIDHGKDSENVRNISIRHYYETYDSPAMPPLWMILEALTFGTVSVMYSWLPFADQKRIADQLGLGVPVLKSWLHTASYTRNLCAHHARLWNRVYTKTPLIMNKFKVELTPNTKFYAQAIMMQVFLKKISPDSQWAERLKNLMDEYPSIPKDRMGFPPDWKTRPIWN